MPEPQPPGVAGAWVGYLIFALLLMILLFFDAQAAYEGEWANFAGVTVFILALAIGPTGGLKWLRRFAQSRKPPTRSGYRG